MASRQSFDLPCDRRSLIRGAAGLAGMSVLAGAFPGWAATGTAGAATGASMTRCAW